MLNCFSAAAAPLSFRPRKFFPRRVKEEASTVSRGEAKHYSLPGRHQIEMAVTEVTATTQV
jgi:hypothetical protein